MLIFTGSKKIIRTTLVNRIPGTGHERKKISETNRIETQ